MLSPGMILRVDGLQPLLGDMGIDLGGTYINMTQHHLYRSEICTPFQKMSGEGVSKGVWGDFVGKPGLYSISF